MIHPSDAHLAPLERAARIYCGMRGIDPDATVDVAHPDILGMTRKREAWLFAATELLELSMKLNALHMASESEPTRKNTVQ